MKFLMNDIIYDMYPFGIIFYRSQPSPTIDFNRLICTGWQSGNTVVAATFIFGTVYETILRRNINGKSIDYS